MKATLTQKEIKQIVNTDLPDPFSFLGAHYLPGVKENCFVVRVNLPTAKSVSVILEQNRDLVYQMELIHPEGLYEVIIPKEKITPYLLKITWGDDSVTVVKDTYSFLPVIDNYYLHLFNEGTNYNIYEKQGGHLITHGGVMGAHFAVWAPNAARVSVAGDFNNWDGRRNPMRVRGTSGVWEIFIPDLGANNTYKFEIKTKAGHILLKSDPCAFYGEMRPNTASILFDINNYEWNDDKWVERRKKTNYLLEPLSVYEVHLGSWARKVEDDNSFLNYRELAPQITTYMKKLGYTHLEVLPIQEHPLDESWGYQGTGYFASTSRFGTPEDFMYFIDYLHQNDIGIIIDWVPSHFAKDAHGLIQFDGTSLYEHEDPRKGEHIDWGTLIFNYGRNEIISFLISNALFWCKKYHIDGLRVDAVASMIYLDYSRKDGEWIPNKYGSKENLEAIEFLKKFNEVIHAQYPGILTIAEESTAFSGVSRPTYLGGLGFTMKWNMGWMNDLLEYISHDPIYRKYHHNNLTFPLMYAFTENFILVLSHDEVVHGKGSLLNKMPGDKWQKFANLRLFIGYMYAHPGKKLLFMGADMGQWTEWNNGKSLDWHLLEERFHSSLQKFFIDLNALYKQEHAMWEIDFNYKGFEWIDFHDWEGSVLSFIRKAKNSGDFLVCVFNFTPVTRTGYRIGVPEHCYYKEILNSDSAVYNGSDVGNLGGLEAEPIKCHGFPFSLPLTIPPLSVLFLKPSSR